MSKYNKFNGMLGRKKISRFIVYILLILGSLITIFPFVWLIRSSLMEVRQIFIFPPQWIPDPLKIENYIEAMQAVPFGKYFINTIIIVVGVISGTLISCSLAAFSFARLRWPGRNIIFGLLISTMMLPYMVTIIPTFMIWKYLGLTNTFVPLIAPAWFASNAFSVFLLRQFYKRIPYSLDEAAYVDGANPFQVYLHIFLPLGKPAMIVVGIFTFMWSWNDLLGPVIYLTDPDKFTLAIGLSQFTGLYTAQWNLLMAASVIVILPVIIVFFIAQKYFIEGISMTGMKG